jgi:predicted DsbA family dithiol-disulfide isomerase
MAVLGAYGLSVFYEKNKAAQFGTGPSRVVERFFSLPEVEWPSTISPYMVVQATERFEDATICVVTYADLLCGDCLLLYEQMKRLSREFEGKLNVAFQFFPLDAQCNDVVDKNSHPGACDLSYIAAHDPDNFRSIYDAIFTDFEAASDEAWRAKLAEKYGVEAALDDPDTKDLVYRILRTGAEYEKTSDRWKHGIRSTPTMIVNNRMLIGTFPYSHLRAIFAALIEGENYESEELHRVRKHFMEHWVMD